MNGKGLPYTGIYLGRYFDSDEGNFPNYSHFRNKLISGDWVAVGYEIPRRSNSKLQILPKDALEAPTFDLKNSGISGDGLAFTGLRVVHHSLINEFQVNPKKLPGRPSQREHIINAYKRLRDQGQIDFSAPLKDLNDPIRNIVAAETGIPLGELRGVGTEAIRIIVRPLFDEDAPNKL